eukprot:Nk52_evm35s295 gene=Nk52_evmTU35s295
MSTLVGSEMEGNMGMTTMGSRSRGNGLLYQGSLQESYPQENRTIDILGLLEIGAKSSGCDSSILHSVEQRNEITKQIAEKGLNPRELYSLYKNRSVVNAGLHEFNEALCDANVCILLNSKCANGWIWKSVAHCGLNQIKEAKVACEEGMKLDSNEHMLSELMRYCKAKLNCGSEVICEEEDEEEMAEEPEKQAKDNMMDGEMNDAFSGNIGGHESQSSCAVDDVECPLCFRVMFSPTVLKCGHTYCRSCIERASDFDLRCPVCRAGIEFSRTNSFDHIMTPNLPLQKMIVKYFPDECNRRKEDELAIAKQHENKVPLFLLDCFVAPVGMSFPMVLFEPRYKVFLRRCMKFCNSKFGIVYQGQGEEKNMCRIGVMLQVVSHAILEDGRYIINTKSLYRFEADDIENVDGYWLGRVRELLDPAYMSGDGMALDGGEEEAEENQSDSSKEAELQFYGALFKGIVEKCMKQWTTEKQISDARARYGETPNSNSTLSYISFWVLNLIEASPEDKNRLLCTSDTLTRLKETYTLMAGPAEKISNNYGEEGPTSSHSVNSFSSDEQP